MLCRKVFGVLTIVFTLTASQLVFGQTIVFEDDFQSYGAVNPAPDPLGPWTYSGPGGANASRTFDAPGGGGAGLGSIGWISIVDDSALNTTVSLGPLAGTEWADGAGNLFDANVYTLSFVHAAETSGVDRAVGFSYGLGGAAIAFQSGGNGDDTQSFSSLVDGGSNSGGGFGKSPDRTWSVNFTGTALTTGDEIDFQIARTGPTAGAAAFTFFDDIRLSVSDGVIDPPVINTGSRVVYDNTMGSPLDQNWTGSELSLPGVDADMDGRIDGVVGDVPSENHGPVVASTGDDAWQYNDDWTQDGGDDPLDNGTFIYPLNPATAANMSENGFTYTMTLENLGSDGGFLSIGSLSDGTTGLFGTGESARTRWGILGSEVPVDAQLHDVSWTWDPDAQTMSVLVDGIPASNVITGGTNPLFGGSVPGGAVFTWGDSTANNPNTALNLVHGDLTVVPEPSSVGLLLFGVVGLVLRRRR